MLGNRFCALRQIWHDSLNLLTLRIKFTNKGYQDTLSTKIANIYLSYLLICLTVSSRRDLSNAPSFTGIFLFHMQGQPTVKICSLQ